MKKVTHLLIAAIILGLGLGALVWTYQPQVSTITKKPDLELKVDKKATFVGQFLQLKGFSRIDRVVSEDEKGIIVEGVYLTEYGQFRYNKANDQITMLMALYDEPENVIQLSHGLIQAQDQGLVYSPIHGDPTLLTDSVKHVEDLYYSLSNNEKKIIYYHPDKARLVSFDFESKKHKVMKFEVDQSIFKDFKTSVVPSPEGGYFIYYVKGETQGSTYFGIYGSDSGRTYIGHVKGHHPTWANQGDLKVAFYFYRDGASKLQFPPSGDRVGYFDLDKNTFVYTGAKNLPYSAVGDFFWHEGTLTVLGKSKEDQSPAIMVYDYTKAQWVIQSLDMAPDQWIIKGIYPYTTYRVYALEADNTALIVTDHDLVHYDTHHLGKTSRVGYVVEPHAILYQNESGQVVKESSGISQNLGQFDQVKHLALLGDHVYFVTSQETSETLYVSTD